MLEADDHLLREKVISLDGVLVYYRSRDPVVTLCPSIGPTDLQSNELCIVPRSMIPHVQFLMQDGRGCYLVDEENSPVIQFHRSRLVGNILSRGRIWATFRQRVWNSVLGREIECDKGKEFEQFFSSIARWMRRSFHKEPQFGFYCGPAAWEWYCAGGRISQF